MKWIAVTPFGWKTCVNCGDLFAQKMKVKQDKMFFKTLHFFVQNDFSLDTMNKITYATTVMSCCCTSAYIQSRANVTSFY